MGRARPRGGAGVELLWLSLHFSVMPCCSNLLSALFMFGCTGYCPVNEEPACPLPWYTLPDTYRRFVEKERALLDLAVKNPGLLRNPSIRDTAHFHHDRMLACEWAREYQEYRLETTGSFLLNLILVFFLFGIPSLVLRAR